MTNNEQLFEINGQVDGIIYRNEQNGYTVLELSTDETLITATGILPLVNAGECVKLFGVFKNHPTYGEQFAVSAFERTMPENLDGILKYLSSGAVKGVGPSTARRLVLEFGADTLTVLETDPERVAKLKGISLKKAQDISEQLKSVVGIRELMIYLANYSITPNAAVRIWKKLGNNAVAAIEENPYILCEEGIGISFETADMIALAHDCPNDARVRVRAALAYVLKHNRLNGHTCLPQHKLIEATASLLEIEPESCEAALREMLTDSSLICDTMEEKEFIFLPPMYDGETYIASRMKMLMRYPAMSLGSAEEKIAAIEQESGIQYADLQKKAISDALNTGLLILTGGPGTGKTTTLNAIIRLLRESGQKVSLCAPTGRAAQRMTAVTGVEAKTIHRMLEVSYDIEDKPVFKRNERNLLNTDALIVDEVSMVDVQLLESLMRALPLSCRLILVGDSNQLPSVGAGNVLHDLIESGVIPVVTLNEIFRQSMQSLIVTNAHKIIGGEMPDIRVRDNDFFFMQDFGQEHIAETVGDLCARRLKNAYGYSLLENIQVLSPTRKGVLGTYELNNRLQSLVNPHPSRGVKVGFYTLYEGDKVMQSRNNYDIPWSKDDGECGEGIFNGDIGIMIEVNNASKAYKVKFDDRVATYDGDSVTDLELAYASTVHKSQGNEFDCVILPMFRTAPQLMYRNLLYTAVTRAKKMLILIGDEGALRMMVENNRRILRYTGLKAFLMRD
ncbi:ATP-dependent RecD-like DNA helicase [Ruminococcus sp.]|uniref:SF1B family DNA helicase RecD2 n=1 Tax=Ruminococcus sp. TaxID=41978 RepID=UPI00388D6F63